MQRVLFNWFPWLLCCWFYVVGSWRKGARCDPYKFSRHSEVHLNSPNTYQSTNHGDVWRQQAGSFYGDECNISEHWRSYSFKIIHAIRDVQERALSLFAYPRYSQSTTLVRPKITGMTLIAERPNIKYSSAIPTRIDTKVKTYLYGSGIVLN